MLQHARTIILSGNLPIHCRDGELGYYAPSSSSVASSILYGLDRESRKNSVFIGVGNPEGMPSYKHIQKSDCVFKAVQTTKRPKDLVFSHHLSQACHYALGKSALFPEDLEGPYRDYMQFNQEFMNTLKETYEQNDTVIILGKHLLMLPSLIRKEFPIAKIVLVYLCPFPPYELFSCIPYCKEVLRSIIACDRVEMQNSTYLDNFVFCAFLSINAQNKEISPKGIESIKGNTSISLIDKEKEREKGTPLMPCIQETESMLSCISESYYIDSIGMDKKLSPSLEPVDEDPFLEEYLADTFPVVNSLHKPYIHNKTYVVYAESERVIATVSPNNGPKEFIKRLSEMEEYKKVYSKLSKSKEGRKTVLVVETTREIGAPTCNLLSVLRYLEKNRESETDFIRCIVYGESAAYHNTELSGLAEKISSLFPNRFSTLIFPNAYLYFSLLSLADVCLVGSSTDSMSLVASEYSIINKKGKIVAPYSSGIYYTNATYTLNCPEITSRVIDKILKEKPQEAETESICSTQEWINSFQCMLRTDTPVAEESSNKKPVHISKNITEEKARIKKAYDESEKRMIFLDYDGTMTEIVPNPRDAKPTEEILSILTNLHKDKRNNVFIVTGRSKEESEEWFGHLGISIYAEHGAYKKENGKWTKVPCDLTWIPDAIKIIEEYVSYTPGTNIEIKNTCVVFHCKEYGKWCASALKRVLGDRARIVTGKNIIEVRPIGIDKGSCIEKEATYNCFTLCAGDDATDEDMFMVLFDASTAYSILVGERETCASFRATKPEDLRMLLKYLTD